MEENLPTAATETKPPKDRAEVVVAPEICEPTPPKKRTWGNIIYDIPIFGGVAWAGVAFLSAVSAHESMYGTNKYFGWLRALQSTIYTGLKSGLGKTILKNAPEEIVDGYAKGTTMFATLGMGGNALMSPIKWM